MPAINESGKIWFNGDLKPWNECQVHILSHAIHYGSSVFEGIRSYNTEQGPVVFRLTDHIQRLLDSAKIYSMHVEYTVEELVQACKEVLNENKLTDAYLRPLIMFGYGSIGVLPTTENKIETAIAAFPWGAYLGEDSLENGVDVGVSSWNRVAPNTIPTGAKAGGNYLSSQLVAREAKRHGYAEGIALDVNGHISEGSGENIFILKNGMLYTPPQTAAILKGLTRDTVMTLAAELGYPTKEEAMTREALYLADEIFMTGTAAEIVPVRSVDGIKVGHGGRGPVTEKLQETFFGLFNGKTQDKWGWLEPVSAKTIKLDVAKGA